MKSLNVLILIVIILLTSCESKDEPIDVVRSINIDSLIQSNAQKVSIKIGIAGTIYKIEGNCMPMVGGNVSCRSYPVSRTIFIFNYTNDNEVEGLGPLYNAVNSKLITHCNSDQDGFFQVTVDPGKYSVFIKENDNFYGNSFDGQGGIQPIIVKTDSVNIMTLVLDYAVY